MADEYILKHLQDVLDAINEMQSCFVDFPNRFDLFEQDIMRRCVVERKTEIMGEAINRIMPDIFFCSDIRHTGLVHRAYIVPEPIFLDALTY